MAVKNFFGKLAFGLRFAVKIENSIFAEVGNVIVGDASCGQGFVQGFRVSIADGGFNLPQFVLPQSFFRLLDNEHTDKITQGNNDRFPHQGQVAHQVDGDDGI